MNAPTLFKRASSSITSAPGPRDRARTIGTVISLLALVALSLVVVPVTAEAALRGPAPIKAIKKAAASSTKALTKRERAEALWRWRKAKGSTTKPTPKPRATSTATATSSAVPTSNVPTTSATSTPTVTVSAAPTTSAPEPSWTVSQAPTTAAPEPSWTLTQSPTAAPTTAAPTPTASTAPATTAQATTAPATTAPATTAPATTPPASTGPSGLAMPKGDISGWKQVFADDFGSFSSSWGKYSGQPGGNPAGWWMPSHTYTSGGSLILDGYADGGKNASGGAAAWGATQLTYGKYEVRFKADVGTGYGYAFLLWPASGAWPIDGEIDFAEDGGFDRQSTAATLHYGSNNSQIGKQLNADFSQWHTIGVEWTAGKLVYTLDGKPWASVTGTMVPSKPMFLAVQQAALPCTQWSSCVNATTPASTKIHIDWVVAYAPSSSSTSNTSTSAALVLGLPLAALAGVSPVLGNTRRRRLGRADRG